MRRKENKDKADVHDRGMGQEVRRKLGYDKNGSKGS